MKRNWPQLCFEEDFHGKPYPRWHPGMLRACSPPRPMTALNRKETQ